jgi:hypothetical protein
MIFYIRSGNFPTIRLASSNIKFALLSPVGEYFVPQLLHFRERRNILIIKREENRIVRNRFSYNFIVFPYEFVLHMPPCCKYVLFSLLLFIFLIFHAWKVATALFKYFSWRLVTGQAFVNGSVSSSCQELTHAEARGQLIIIMGWRRNVSGGSESRLGAASSTRLAHDVFTVETADTVPTEDHNSQLIQEEGEFLDCIIKLAELSVIIMAS